jgi:enoyl-CoA hydratase/carnithine racemase
LHFVTLFRNVDTNHFGRRSIMSGLVTYRRDESIATITMDDGKVNALGPTMQQALNEALDNADRDDVDAVVIAGNHRVFSAGFDLKVFQAGEPQGARRDTTFRPMRLPSGWSYRTPRRRS